MALHVVVGVSPSRSVDMRGSGGAGVFATIYTLAAAHTFEVAPADWAVRLLHPPASGDGRAWGEGPSTDAAETALYERKGLVPEPLNS